MQLPQRHLYLMERLEDKMAAINARITGWKKALTAALAAAAPAAGAAAGSDAAAAAEGLEIAPVGVPVQVGVASVRRRGSTQGSSLQCFRQLVCMLGINKHV
jgi:hypothetical protein